MSTSCPRFGVLCASAINPDIMYNRRLSRNVKWTLEFNNLDEIAWSHVAGVTLETTEDPWLNRGIFAMLISYGCRSPSSPSSKLAACCNPDHPKACLPGLANTQSLTASLLVVLSYELEGLDAICVFTMLWKSEPPWSSWSRHARWSLNCGWSRRTSPSLTLILWINQFAPLNSIYLVVWLGLEMLYVIASSRTPNARYV